MILRSKNITTLTETKYKVSQEDFKKTLGLPNKAKISFLWLGFDDDIEITIKE